MHSCSVIIPTFNRAHVLVRALDSVATQTRLPDRLIVVDDHSSDGTEDLVKSWISQRQPRMEVIFERASARGVSAARNLGVSRSGTEWVAFLDSDDEWLPQKLERQFAVSDGYAIVHTQENWIRNGVTVSQPKKYAKSGGRVFNRCVDLCFISPSTVLMTNELFREMNGFREDFPVCEDYDLWLRIAAKYEIGFVEEPLINKYGGHSDQLSMQYKAMDYYRAKALAAILASPELKGEERTHAAATLREKCDILLAGYRKYSNLENVSEVEGWRSNCC